MIESELQYVTPFAIVTSATLRECYYYTFISMRLSRANLKARESVFGAGSEAYRGEIQATCPASLSECVMALEDCCEEARKPMSRLIKRLEPVEAD